MILFFSKEYTACELRYHCTKVHNLSNESHKKNHIKKCYITSTLSVKYRNPSFVFISHSFIIFSKLPFVMFILFKLVAIVYVVLFVCLSCYLFKWFNLVFKNYFFHWNVSFRFILQWVNQILRLPAFNH